MKINYDNYETYFLLLVDNELSADERKMVENFVSQHPALKEELECLQHTILSPNESFDYNKASLYKSATAPGTIQEKMLLSLDQELKGGEADELLNKIQADEALLNEWTLLQRTKLDAAEVIVFPNKEILYRKEAGKVVSIAFLKWAVAAAIIGGGIFWGLNVKDNIYVNSNSTALNIEKGRGSNIGTRVKKETTIAVQPKQDKGIQAEPGTESGSVKESNQLAKNDLNEKQNPVYKKETTPMPATTVVKAAGIKQPVLSNEVAKAVKGIRKPEINMLNIKKTNSDKPELLAAMSAKEKPENLGSSIAPKIDLSKNSYASVTLLNETPGDDDHIFLLEEDRLAESKAGAFLKKVKRTVTRTTNISAGKTLKIAGFEFAVK